MGKKLFLHWSVILPLMAIPLFVFTLIVQQAWLYIPLTFLLIIAVLASVHHAEVIADKVGEPLGTLILALAVTIIEVSLVISLMIAGGKSTQTLARDTVFSAVMIILTGIVGLCLLLGGAKYREQSFRRSGVNVALITLTAILVLTLVLPNFTTSVPGPQYSAVQLIFVGIISLILYSAFVWVQTKLHRDYFTAETASANEEHEQIPTNAAFLSGGLLLLSLVMVVIIAKKLSSPIELLLQQINAPQTLLGIIIAMVILLP
ncbi:MAG TPA: ionic transporter y4hA, partial [Chitinophagales bacterium]|nr:ionic transporter y4hA [Chitinophagales bacterium]